MTRSFRAFVPRPSLSTGVNIFDGEIGRRVPHFETAERHRHLQAGLRKLGVDAVYVSDRIESTGLLTVHSWELVDFYQDMAGTAPTERPLFPDSFRSRRSPGMPVSLPGRFGHFCTDVQTPFVSSYWADALVSAKCAVTAAEAVVRGKNAYALCRPPGHHAGPDYFGGFCYINNTALAAKRLSDHFRVAVLDVDYHHGNGTQDCFYSNPDVFTCSLHADPAQEYPYFCGYPSERGEGDALGTNLNLVLPVDTEAAEWFKSLESALDAIKTFDAECLVLAFGADTYREDPVGGFPLDYEHYEELGRKIGHLGLPFLIVQEGGYSGEALALIIGHLLLGLGVAAPLNRSVLSTLR